MLIHPRSKRRMLRLALRSRLLASGFVLCVLASGASAQDVEQPDAASARIRWGLALGGGPMVGGYSGGAGGIEGRIGAQLSPMFAVYAQPLLLLGAGLSASAHGASATGLAVAGVGVLADLTLADLFYLAAGPEVLLGVIGTGAASVQGAESSASASAATGPFFGITARAGFAFGSKRPSRRKAFTVGLNLHAIFAGDVAVLPLITLGFEAF
jgi:hypothetical protein